jgi:hypothetical protein
LSCLQTVVELPSEENYSGCGKPFETYAAAMQHASMLMAEKGLRPAAAAEKAGKQFRCVLPSEAVFASITHYILGLLHSIWAGFST